MSKAEQAAEEIHEHALLEAKKYAAFNGNSIFLEVAFGRGFKEGFIKGYEQAEKDINKEIMDRMEKYREMQEKALLADHNYGIHIDKAKKYLMLTWEDMQLIWQLCDTLNSEQPNLCSSKDFFTEVLNRFNKSKEMK